MEGFPKKIKIKNDKSLIFNDRRDEDENDGRICPVCALFMQDEDPNLPRYYKKKKMVVTNLGDDGVYRGLIQ